MFYWLAENKTWVFSGIGVFILSLFFVHSRQSQKGGKDSRNYQSGRDMNVTVERDQNNDR